MTRIFLKNLSEFVYIDYFYSIISTCCKAVQIYYNGT